MASAVTQHLSESTGNPAPEHMLDITERLLAYVKREESCLSDRQYTVPVEHYLSEDRFELERDVIFRKYPLIVAHESELPEPGTCLRHDGMGVPMVLTRDAQGTVRAFLNVCRHRGMRLQEESLCHRKTLVCPYHGWTYKLDGELKNVPHEEFFPEMSSEDFGLVELPCEVRNGLVWVIPSKDGSIDIAEWLGSMSEDMSYLGMDGFDQYRREEGIYDNNWKLIIDAFLEAYHVKVLHRNSVYPFFMDSMALADPVNRHIRSVIARRRANELFDLPKEQWDLREHVSFSHFIFPNTILVHHPDYSSVLTFYPVAADKMRWVHHMLIPSDRNTEAERGHWEKTFDLIHNHVFRAEDVHAAEQIQLGLASGANSEITLGRMEQTIELFHRTLQQSLDEPAQP